MLKNNEERYGTLSKSLHWLMAILIVLVAVAGIIMTGLAKEDPQRASMYMSHKSLGMLVLLLLIARVAWLRASPAPSLPIAFDAKETRITKGIQALLYALMALIPVSGYVMSTAAGKSVSFFGLFQMPALFDPNKGLAGFAHTAHEFMAYGILAFAVIHALGAIKHRLADKGGPRDILERML